MLPGIVSGFKIIGTTAYYSRRVVGNSVGIQKLWRQLRIILDMLPGIVSGFKIIGTSVYYSRRVVGNSVGNSVGIQKLLGQVRIILAKLSGIVSGFKNYRDKCVLFSPSCRE